MMDVKGQTPDQLSIVQQKSDNARVPEPCRLQKLPLELLLQVTDNLDKVSQTLLRLTCRPLYTNLKSHRDYFRRNIEDYRTLLQCIEPDLPDHMICHACVHLYQWRTRADQGFQCPHPFAYKAPKDSNSDIYDPFDYASHFAHSRLPTIHVLSLEDPSNPILDLVHRAHKYGPAHGLPLAYLDVQCGRMSGVHQDMQARMFENRIIYGSRWHQVLTTGAEKAHLSGLLENVLDAHGVHAGGVLGYPLTFDFPDNSPAWCFESVTSRPNYDIQFLASFSRRGGGLWRVEVKVWQVLRVPGELWSFDYRVRDRAARRLGKWDLQDVFACAGLKSLCE